MEIVLLLSLGFILLISLFIYRLNFHPLSHIPGHPLAKITYLYEWYYDLYRVGQYSFKIADLHRRYGPIIRINPDEVHIDDPYFFDQIFNQTNGRTEKPKRVAEVFGPFSATIATQHHDLHRVRRSAVNPFFSKKSVNDLVPVIWKPIDMLLERLRNASQTGEVLNMKYFYAAVTQDIINAYCFAHEPTITKSPDFGQKLVDDVDGFLMVSLINLHIPWVMRMTYSFPDWLNKILSPNMANLLDFRLSLLEQKEAIRNGEDTSYQKAYHRTIFHELLSSKLPPQELEAERIRDEAFSLMTAGSGTTNETLRIISITIYETTNKSKRLHEELEAAIPDINQPPSLTALQNLPYLTAVIKEGLRMSDPVAHRINRQFPDTPFDYHGTFIPANAVVGMSAIITHHNEDLFPQPYTFRPERWLGLDGQRLDRFLVTFNKGTRACLGINLAQAELTIILAAVFRQFDFDVSQVKRERDIDVSRSFIQGAQAPDSVGILVKVKVC
ncbi:benzoate 4-monooxygenase cytochrome P450 [Penicillium angulare]|uniref:Benzoate 4-monooxygenase cytochrome P450 n=1 Tax=Penicillium angulare TaxID=116970 RepID=A0A9W9FY64_9EURO|nr:benzoate 4-monooxygenase cytochrome P450 [Penicillium angulare]